MTFDKLLLDRRIVSETDLARAREVCSLAGGRAPVTLVRLGLAAEQDVAHVAADAAGLELIAADRFPAEAPGGVADVNPAFLRRRAVLPLECEGGRLTLAMADPEDEEAGAGLAFAAGAASLVRQVATFSDIQHAIGALYPEESEELPAFAEGAPLHDLERVLEDESDAPVIRLVQRLLAGAVDRRASDVHIEPLPRALAVRYRVDGRLIEVERHPESLAGPVASRIKVMAGLDIAETRLPQDGRLRLTVRGSEVDVRVSTSPVAHGESLVLRLLGRSSVPLDLDRLGLPGPALARLHHALDRPHGIILLTGPTGSGKTTTLYAAINRLLRPEVKILTVEDPVEVLIEGVNQVQVRPDIGLSYAATLRAFLRQDPDILMIGEIRDRETAEIALRAALTGHLVLSTLHTNSALGAFTRLGDIGIEPYLTASTVIATAAQRLIRAICSDCAGSRAPSAAELTPFAVAGLPAPAAIPEARGCPRCGGSGYSGRIPLIEIIEADEPLRAAIREGRTADLEAVRPPSETLLGHGLALVAAGRTTIEEVERAVQLG